MQVSQARSNNSHFSSVTGVNPKHPLILRLAERVGESGSGEDLEAAARLLLDQARILEGEPLADPASFARRLSEMMARGLAQ